MDKKPSLDISVSNIENLEQLSSKEQIICSTVCQGILRNPIKCSLCNLHICKDCLETWRLKDKKCPNCRKLFKGAKADETVLKDLAFAQMRCPYPACGVVFDYYSLITHLETGDGCQFRPDTCKWCKKEGLRKEIVEHLNVCNLKETKCKGCSKVFKGEEITSHNILECLTKKVESLEEIVLRKKRMKFPPKWANFSIEISPSRQKAKGTRDLHRLSSVAVLKPKFNKLSSFTIRINSLTCWIGIGISTYDFVAAQNFTFSDYVIENRKHEGYMISSNGLRWSSTDEDENFDGSFYFGQDDMIEVGYNESSKKIFFWKHTTYSQKETGVTLKANLPPNKVFYPIIVLGGVDDVVEVVSSERKDPTEKKKIPSKEV